MAGPGRRRGGDGHRLAAMVILAPMFILVAALGTRTGVWSYETGHDLLTARIGVVLGTMAVLAALALLVAAFRRRASVWLAVLAIVVAAFTLGGLGWHMTRLGSGPADDISTDMAEIPGFGDLDAARRGAGPTETAGVEVCPGALPAMTQVAPESVLFQMSP